MTRFNLAHDQVAVVTGGSNGIGRALVETLVIRGLRVISLDAEGRRPDSVGQASERVHSMQVDVRDREAMTSTAREIVGTFGAVDLLCNNAGVGLPRKPLWEIGAEEARHVLEVNVCGVLNSIRAFVPSMIQRDAGHVLNTCSFLGLSIKPGGGNGVYAASKHAVVALSETLAHEFATLNVDIGVTCLCPGPVSTRLLRGSRAPANKTVRGTWPAWVDVGLSEMSPSSVAETALDAVERGERYAVIGKDTAEFVLDRLGIRSAEVQQFWNRATD